MKTFSALLALIAIGCNTSGKEIPYAGSTPAPAVVREFLGISLTDSIDFIRWKLVIRPDSYELNCRYGVSKGGTKGFVDGKEVAFSGKLRKQGHYFVLQREGRTISILEINSNLLHLLDGNKNLLAGKWGYSYALNSNTPVKSDQFNLPSKQSTPEYVMAFQGRTLCQELSVAFGKKSYPGLQSDEMVYYFVHRFRNRETIHIAWKAGEHIKKKRWRRAIGKSSGKDGRIIYKLNLPQWPDPLYLLKADDNILFFTDAEGNLLVGNEDFSYTLNPTEDREPLTSK